MGEIQRLQRAPNVKNPVFLSKCVHDCNCFRSRNLVKASMATNLIVNILELADRLPDNWLIGCDSREFSRIVDRLFQEITQNQARETPPKICLAEPEPVQFLASFTAARAAQCPIFLCNPNWVKPEWQQVFDLVQPDLILGEYPLPNNPHIPVRLRGLRLYSREFHSPTKSGFDTIMTPTGRSERG